MLCTNIRHNKINCLDAELPFAQWCDHCQQPVLAEMLRLKAPSRPRTTRTRKPAQSESMKRFLKIKFPTHVGTSPESEYSRVMGRYPTDNVDITLEHDGQVIHCNDATGLKVASKYLKGLTLEDEE